MRKAMKEIPSIEQMVFPAALSLDRASAKETACSIADEVDR
jgi:hypothetical protein